MKVLVVTSSPNVDGLTRACGEAARQGVVDGRSPARVIHLSDFQIERCAVCDDGWGSCRTEHRCRLEDEFRSLQEMFEQAEGYAIVTPVYFGGMSESATAFFDRLRRCEATKSGAEKSALAGKPAVCVAAAGGSGRGAVHCLFEMERLLTQLQAAPFDFIAVTQRTREYQLETIHDALSTMCAGPPSGPAQATDGGKRRRPWRRRPKARQGGARERGESPAPGATAGRRPRTSNGSR